MSIAKIYKYHYFYKITNKYTNQYYLGIHSTNDLNDNYMGSGTFLKKEYKKYGRDCFVKEILKFFDNREDLIDYEKQIVNENTLKDALCLNIIKGGVASLEQGFTIGLVTVQDKDGNCFDVKTNDPRYLSGELVSINKGKVTVKDKFGRFYKIFVNDPRYISGELTIVSKGNKSIKGKIMVGKGDIYMYIDKENLSQYINEGWEKKSKQKGRISPTKGMVWVCRDDKQKIIQKDELQQYLNDGWTRSRITKPSVGSVCVTKDNIERFVQKDELQQYLNDGWVKKGKSRNKGKLTVVDKEGNYIQIDKTDPRWLNNEVKLAMFKNGPSCKGLKYIHKGHDIKRVKPNLIQQYLDDGWKLGMRKE